jgi:hypothetical protein
MQEFDFTSISIAVASISVVLGVILAIMQLRDQNKTRQAQLFMEVYSRFERPEFLDSFFLILNMFNEHREDSHPEEYMENRGKLLSVLLFFESIGVLVSRKLIDIHLVADLVSTSTITTWRSIEKWTKWRRVNEKRPQLWKWVEYLYHEIQKLPSRQAQGKIDLV